MTSAVPRVLSIAGSDSGGGAGVQADLKTIAAWGGYGMTAITAITAQNTQGVQAVHPLPVDVVRAQLDSIAADIAVDAVKIGMLGTAELMGAVAGWLEETRPAVVVVRERQHALQHDRPGVHAQRQLTSGHRATSRVSRAASSAMTSTKCSGLIG